MNVMAKMIFYQGSYPFKYYLLDLFTNKPYEVSEEDFFEIVGYDRRLVPMHYDKENINRQNFFLGDTLIAYRVRQKKRASTLFFL